VKKPGELDLFPSHGSGPLYAGKKAPQIDSGSNGHAPLLAKAQPTVNSHLPCFFGLREIQLSRNGFGKGTTQGDQRY
jgi:hypothetical protein